MQLLEQEIAQQEEEADSIEQFILRAKKYPNLQELTPAVLHDLVNKVYVHAPDKSSGQRVQDVHISLACIGFLPESIIAEMLTHASKAEQRDSRHAVLSKPYKPVLCAATLRASFLRAGTDFSDFPTVSA